MKHRVTLIFFVIGSLIFISCPLQTPQAIPEGFHFDEAKFQEAKQKWENAVSENYDFKYVIELGGSENPPFRYALEAKITVKNGIPYEDKFSPYGFSGETTEEVADKYHVTSLAFMSLDDAYRFIEERVEAAKNLYDNGKCSYYEAKIDYNDYYGDYGVIYKFSDSYIFKGKKRIDGPSRASFVLKWFTISNTP